MKICSICKKPNPLKQWYCTSCRKDYTEKRKIRLEQGIPTDFSKHPDPKRSKFTNKDIKENESVRMHFLKLYKEHGVLLHTNKQKTVVLSDVELTFDSLENMYYFVPTEKHVEIINNVFIDNLRSINPQAHFHELYNISDKYYILINPDFVYVDKDYKEIEYKNISECFDSENKMVIHLVYDRKFSVGTSFLKLLVLSYVKQD